MDLGVRNGAGLLREMMVLCSTMKKKVRTHAIQSSGNSFYNRLQTGKNCFLRQLSIIVLHCCKKSSQRIYAFEKGMFCFGTKKCRLIEILCSGLSKEETALSQQDGNTFLKPMYSIACTQILLKLPMVAPEFKEPIEVNPSTGDGSIIWYMIGYGPHSNTLYTIIMNATGKCWQVCYMDFHIKPNVTLGIGGAYRQYP